MRLSCLLFCMMASAIPTAYADECPNQTQSGLNACADAAYKKADAALNGAYQEIVGRLKDDSAKTKLLVAAEKAWLSYRDAECAFSSSANAGGSLYPLALSTCLEALTKTRTQQLGVYLKCGEGDTSCPVPAQ